MSGKTLRRLVTACLLTAGATAWAQVDRGRGVAGAGAGQGAAGDAARGVQRASCVLQLEFDPNRGMRTDTQTLNALLTSTAVVDPAAQKALGLGPDAWPKVAQVELIPAGQAAVKLGVTITRNPDVKLPDNAAQSFLDELATRAKAAVDQVGQRQEQAAAERLATLEKEHAAAKKRLEAAQARLNQRGDATFAAGPDSRAMIPNLTIEKQNLETQMAGQRARVKVIEQEIDRLTKTASARGAGSPWTELVAAREKVVQALRARREKGQVDDLDLFRAEADVAEARALAAAQPAQRTGFDPLDRWFGEVVTLRANLAESEVRLASVNQRLEKAAASTHPGAPQTPEDARQEEAAARQALYDLTSRLEQARRERQLAGGGARLLILDGKPRE